jgi:predicted house-cleaning NTP pyrophosphatase (Maf/HAM1 superfamily)
MSDTPETDAAQHEGLLRTNPIPLQVVTAEFARRLERGRDEARQAFVIATDQMVIAQGKVRKAERERDEARELLASEKITRNHIIEKGGAIEKDRDEARESRNKWEKSAFDLYALCEERRGK